jgi:hypothetical protein
VATNKHETLKGLFNDILASPNSGQEAKVPRISAGYILLAIGAGYFQ